MGLADLPSLVDQQKVRRAMPKSAIVPRVEVRRAKVADSKKAEAEAKRKVWTRAGGKCERCGKHVKKGVDSLTAGHVHHRTFRSKGGTWDVANLELLCPRCHSHVHGGRSR